MNNSNKCVICKSELVHDIVKELNVSRNEVIYGPDGAKQYHIVDKGFHCPTCGIMYKKAPVVIMKNEK